MTPLQQIRTTALAEIRRAKVDHEDQFITHMKYILNNERTKWLTAKQGAYLEKLCWKYREQLQRAGYGHVVPAQNPYEAQSELQLKTT